MVVSDLYKVMCSAQKVSIYDTRKKNAFFSGVCVEIPDSCMDLIIYHVFTCNDIIVITVR